MGPTSELHIAWPLKVWVPGGFGAGSVGGWWSAVGLWLLPGAAASAEVVWRLLAELLPWTVP